MYHVVAYQANTFGQTNFDSTPLADSWIPISNGHYLPPVALNFYGGWMGGVNLTAVTLVTPKTRSVVPPRLYPIQNTLLPPDRPHMYDRRSNPFGLNAFEEVSVQMNVGGAANAFNTAVMFWGNSLDPVPAGDVYTLHGTSTTAVTANAWTQLVVTWDQTIPAGRYMIIGSQVQSTNAIAHRWYFRYSQMKPGFLSVSAVTNISDPTYYQGGWGALGYFDSPVFPFLEVLANAADASHDVVMNMVKIS